MKTRKKKKHAPVLSYISSVYKQGIFSPRHKPPTLHYTSNLHAHKDDPVELQWQDDEAINVSAAMFNLAIKPVVNRGGYRRRDVNRKIKEVLLRGPCGGGKCLGKCGRWNQVGNNGDENMNKTKGLGDKDSTNAK